MRASANYSFGTYLNLTGEVSRAMKNQVEAEGEASSGGMESVPPPAAAADPNAPKLRPHELHSVEETRAALEEARGNVTYAAHSLGLTRDQMNRLIKRYGLRRDSGTD